MLHVNQHERDGVHLVALCGEAGVAEAQELTSTLIDLAASRPKRLVFDFSKLTFISSLAVGELVSLAVSLQRFECRIAVAGASTMVRSALRRARLDRAYEMFDTLEVAIEDLKQEPSVWFVLKQPKADRAPVTP